MTANSCPWTDPCYEVLAGIGIDHRGRLPVPGRTGGDLSLTVVGGRLARRKDALRFRQDGRLRHQPRRGDRR